MELLSQKESEDKPRNSWQETDDNEYQVTAINCLCQLIIIILFFFIIENNNNFFYPN